VMHADVILLIGANVTEGHPVFAAQMKRRLRDGAKLIVADPRVTEIVRLPHVAASYHLQLRPGTNVALINALAHVVVTEGLTDDAFVAERCDQHEFAAWKKFVSDERNSPEAAEKITRRPGRKIRAAARMYASAPNGAIYYGLGVTRTQPGQYYGPRNREPRDGDRKYRPSRRRRESASRPEQRAGFLRHGFFSA